MEKRIIPATRMPIRLVSQREGRVLRYFLALFLLLAVSSGLCELAAAPVTDFQVFFPQVLRGPLSGIFYESILVISNPGSGAVEIKLGSFGLTLPGPATFQLGVLETREIIFADGPFEMGWVSLTSKSPVAASVHISTKPSAGSSEVLEDIVILAQPLASKVIIPIFVKASIAENTAVALAYIQDGEYKFTLLDTQGAEVRSRVEAYGFRPGQLPSPHAAMFVTEIFPDIPADFRRGSLVIEHWSPVPNIAMAFAITALYARGTELASAPVNSVDEPASYLVFLKPGQNIQAQADQLADVYGFQVGRVLRDTGFEALATNEVARALARDKKVSEVHPNAVGTLSP